MCYTCYVFAIGKICPEDPAHKKSLITPSSWREGQKVAESILGPPPKHRKKTTEKDLKRPFSPPTHDTDLHSHKKLQSHTTSSKRPGMHFSIHRVMVSLICYC